ncbi:MAG: hypothetical protein RL654_1939 [Pseudomonadota bacterium]|jgi:hypothetical protein
MTMKTLKTSPAGAADLAAAVEAMTRLSRRDVMRALAALGSAPLLAPASARAALPAGLVHLDAAQAAVMLRLAQVTLPVEGSRLAPWQPEVLLQTLDAALLGPMDARVRAGLRGGIEAFEAAPRATLGRPFTALDDAQACAFCDAWGASTEPMQRGLVTGLKKLVQLSYWAHPSSWPAVGYDGPISERLGLKSLGNAPMPRA